MGRSQADAVFAGNGSAEAGDGLSAGVAAVVIATRTVLSAAGDVIFPVPIIATVSLVYRGLRVLRQALAKGVWADIRAVASQGISANKAPNCTSFINGPNYPEMSTKRALTLQVNLQNEAEATQADTLQNLKVVSLPV